MYGMVLMAAMTGTGDAASFGKKDSCGCTGTVVYSSCSGHHHLFSGGGCHGLSSGSCHGSGIFGLRHTHGCTGAYAGCTGVVVAPPVAVVVAAPACCPAPTCCSAPKKKCFSGLFKKKTCCPEPAPCCGTAVAPVAPVTAPTVMPDKKPVDKKPAGD